ncbi:MAG TPA: SigE family RNA polymerase sigma factor [Micromonosporaceae bacterium]|jgi:RNA polymerase sigma-70 factor (sigma-E family)
MRPDPRQDFVEYVTARLPHLRRTAYLLCGDRHRAEDVVQDTTIALYTKWQLAQAAVNTDGYVHWMLVRQYLRQQRLAWSRVLLSDRTAERAAPSSGSVEERDRVSTALAQVGRRQRAGVVLRYFCDLSVSETATVLGCSEGTVKSQAARALTTLRGLLADPDHVTASRSTKGSTRE